MKDGRVSQTALKISRMMIFFGSQPGYRELIPPGLVEANRRLLEGAGLLRQWHLRVYQTRTFRGLLRVTDRLVGGGAMVHFPLRKRFVEDQVREAIDDAGAQQLLIIGAGLDTLAIRLAAEKPDLLAVEIDHPATGGAKARGIHESGMGSDNLVLVPIDLAEHPLAEALQQTPWRPIGSAVVAEGLLMYLPVEAVRGLFTALHEATGPKSRVVFTWLPEADGEMKLDRLTRSSIAAVGEPVLFSMAPDALEAFLADLGWRLLPPVDLRDRYLSDGPLAGAETTDMERFSVCERM